MALSQGAMSWLMEGSRDLHMLRREKTGYKQMRRQSLRQITDKVISAKRAGVHPLYALGASTSSPQSAIGGTGVGGTGYMGGTSKAEQIQASKESQSRIELNQALKEKALSDAARIRQDANSSQDGYLIDPGGNLIATDNPNIADKGQKTYGEIGETILGGHQWIKDTGKAVKKRHEELKRIRSRKGVKLSPRMQARKYVGEKAWRRMSEKTRRYYIKRVQMLRR